MEETVILNGLEILIGVDIESIRDPEGKTLNHLKWMINEMKTKEFSQGKFNRWLGYIQGVLVMKNITSLNIERERNR